MKKKLFVIFAILFVILLIVGSIYFYLNRVEKVEVKNGKFFDDSGKQLGLCKIESKLRYLTDTPEYTTYYFDSNKNNIGYCEGNVSYGTGCTVSLKQEPKICEPISFQRSCDKSVYPVGFGTTAKYKCIIE